MRSAALDKELEKNKKRKKSLEGHPLQLALYQVQQNTQERHNVENEDESAFLSNDNFLKNGPCESGYLIRFRAEREASSHIYRSSTDDDDGISS